MPLLTVPAQPVVRDLADEPHRIVAALEAAIARGDSTPALLAC